MREAWAAIHFEGSKPVAVAILTADLFRDEGKWLAECLELGTATYASTLEEAQLELAEAVHLQLDEVEALGFLDEFLRDRGVKLLPIMRGEKGTRPRGPSWAMPVLTST